MTGSASGGDDGNEEPNLLSLWTRRSGHEGTCRPSLHVWGPSALAHHKCNQHTRTYEERFRDFIGATIPPDNPAYQVWERSWEGMQHPKARGKKLGFIKRIVNTREYQPEDGSVIIKPLAVTEDPHVVHWTLAKIVKGLYTHKTGAVLPNHSLQWSFGHLRPDSEQVISDNTAWGFEFQDILKVRWVIPSDTLFASLWTLCFYGIQTFHVSTWPDGSEPTVPVQSYVWPGPT